MSGQKYPHNRPSATPDELAVEALKLGLITVDSETGAIWRDGKRAEIVDAHHGYGRVRVARDRTAQAHRVVWIALHGPIPSGLVVNHRNRLRWDNRPENLEIVAPAGNMQHWQGAGYDRVGSADPNDARALPAEWLSDPTRADADPTAINPYGGGSGSVIDLRVEAYE